MVAEGDDNVPAVAAVHAPPAVTFLYVAVSPSGVEFVATQSALTVSYFLV